MPLLEFVFTMHLYEYFPPLFYHTPCSFNTTSNTSSSAQKNREIWMLLISSIQDIQQMLLMLYFHLKYLTR